MSGAGVAATESLVLTGNHAVSHAVRLARADVIAAYPITPQTQVVELLSQFCSDGRLAARFIKVESEHSAMAALVGAANTGARTFTATSSQGLALMHEMLHWAAGNRLPIVMANVNRAMAPPWSVWTDQNDSLSQRDTGWMQFYCQSNQEVLDSVLLAYRLAETVRLPAMVVLDAFVLSHTAEPVVLPDQDIVDRFLPKKRLRANLAVERPAAVGGLASPDVYMEFRYKMQAAMEQALRVFPEIAEEFFVRFGRRYAAVEEYLTEGAETILVTSGTVTGTARETVGRLREAGRSVGVAAVRLFRPFPREAIRRTARGAQRLAVIDRNIGFGSGGIFAQEIRSALYGVADVPVHSFIAGLGGRDITPATIEEIVDRAERAEAQEETTWIGLQK
ncbi:MAG: 2-ketoisovalerate ferredoxin oxidoreductase subunit alpha [Acidobacteriota bacterium]